MSLGLILGWLLELAQFPVHSKVPRGGCELVTPLLACGEAGLRARAHMITCEDQEEAEKGLSAGPLTCTVTLWQEAECDTDSLHSHPAPCHLVRKLYKDHLDPGLVSKKKRIRKWSCARDTLGSLSACAGPRFVHRKSFSMLPGMAPPMPSGPGGGHHTVLITSDLRDPGLEESNSMTTPKTKSQAGSPGLALTQSRGRWQAD